MHLLRCKWKACWKAEQTLRLFERLIFSIRPQVNISNGKTSVSMSNKTFIKRKTRLDEFLAFLPASNWLMYVFISITIKPYIYDKINSCCVVVLEAHQLNWWYICLFSYMLTYQWECQLIAILLKITFTSVLAFIQF